MSKKIVLTTAIILLLVAIAGGGAYVLDQRKKDSTASTETVRPVNDVDYGPAKPEDSSGVESSKDQVAKPDNKPSQPDTSVPETPTGTHTITITQADQAGGQVQIRALVNGATSGACELTLSKTGANSITRSAAVGVQASYAICQGFNIPLSDIPSSGEWTVQIIAKVNGKASSPAQQKVTITK